MKKLIGNSKQKQNFLREIQILKSIDHPNVIKLLDFEIKDMEVNLILEYCPRTLYDYLQCAIYPLNKQNLKTIAHMLLSALKKLHQEGIIHRDIKPQNILINKDNIIKLADFGQAITESERDADGNFAIEGFTYWYKPPELLLGSRAYDWSFDIWQFGCVVGEMLNGAPLFPGANDLYMIPKISQYLGPPHEKRWKNFKQMPNHDAIEYKDVETPDFGEMFPDSTRVEVEFLQKCIAYEGRETAANLLEDFYLQHYPPPLEKVIYDEERLKEDTKKYEEIFQLRG